MCVCVCVALYVYLYLLCLCFVVGFVVLEFLGCTARSVRGRVRILVRHAHEIDTFSMLVSKTVFVVSHSVGQFVMRICKPLKNLSIFRLGFFVFLSLSGNNFVNIDCISIWSQNKLEESLLSVFVVLFSTLSA